VPTSWWRSSIDVRLWLLLLNPTMFSIATFVSPTPQERTPTHDLYEMYLRNFQNVLAKRQALVEAKRREIPSDAWSKPYFKPDCLIKHLVEPDIRNVLAGRLESHIASAPPTHAQSQDQHRVGELDRLIMQPLGFHIRLDDLLYHGPTSGRHQQGRTQGWPQHIIDRISRTVTSFSELDGDTRTRFPTCPITHEDFSPSTQVVTVPGCGHVFSADAALRWFGSQRACPVCRGVPNWQDVPHHTVPEHDQHPGGDRPLDTPHV
jgi:hypothetical protein